MGAAVGDPNFGFDQLKSEDWSDQLANEVGAASPGARQRQPVLVVDALRRAAHLKLARARVAGWLLGCVRTWQSGAGGQRADAGCGLPALQVGEGNSFRREQRERYGMPLLNMTSLAHASEEELLVAAEAQVRSGRPYLLWTALVCCLRQPGPVPLPCCWLPALPLVGSPPPRVCASLAGVQRHAECAALCLLRRAGHARRHGGPGHGRCHDAAPLLL